MDELFVLTNRQELHKRVKGWLNLDTTESGKTIPSEYLSRTLSLRRRKRLITQIATAAAASRILVAAAAVADAAVADAANFCDAFGGDILQLARADRRLPLSLSLFLKVRISMRLKDDDDGYVLNNDTKTKRGSIDDFLATTYMYVKWQPKW